MTLLASRIEKIKAALRGRDLNRAATLLIHTLASDEVFSYWSDCCQGSERVPKILKYIHQITFDEALPTARVDLQKGDLTIGVQFFLDHITGPEDLLFILIHERNHLILRRLYPDVLPGFDYPREVFNFAEDAYVNAIGRRQVASTLPERFYHQPGNSSSLRSTARSTGPSSGLAGTGPTTTSSTPTPPFTTGTRPCFRRWGKWCGRRRGFPGTGSG